MKNILSALQSSSAAGGIICGLSLMELNALLGIVLTITSLILLVVPKAVDLIRKIKAAKADGVITEDEKKEIVDSGLDIVKDVRDAATEISKNVSDMDKSK